MDSAQSNAIGSANKQSTRPMITDTLLARLDFLREAERLKNVLRSGHTSTGRPESTAESSGTPCARMAGNAGSSPWASSASTSVART